MSAPQPAFALRPLEIKHLFDFSIRLLRSGFVPMFMALAMVQLPLVLLNLPFWLQFMTMMFDFQSRFNTTAQLPDAAFWNKYVDLGLYALIMVFVALAYQLLVTPLGSLACARLATTGLLGQTCTFGEALAHARKRYWPTQVALALFLLPLLALALIVLAVVLVLKQAGNNDGVGVAAVLGIMLISLGGFAMVLLFCRLFMALNGVIQAAEVPEGQGILQQGLWLLRRSYELTAGNFWKMLGMLLMLQVILNFVINGMTQGIRYILLFIRLATGGNDPKLVYNALANPTSWELGFTLLLGSLIGLLFAPLWQCFKTLLYFDMRCRKEAFDLLHVLELPGGELEE